MGLTTLGPPEELVRRLRDQIGAAVFVECGTYKGGTASWAASEFDAVYSIENSRFHHEAAKATYGHLQNLHFLFGDTRTVLLELRNRLSQPAIFWIDSHWCGGETHGVGDECPLIEEIAIIDDSGIDRCLLIDDARLFLAPPPPPHEANEWPTIDQVIEALKRKWPQRYIMIANDVIIATPPSVKETVIAWYRQSQEEATALRNSRSGWRALAHALKQIVSQGGAAFRSSAVNAFRRTKY